MGYYTTTPYFYADNFVHKEIPPLLAKFYFNVTVEGDKFFISVPSLGAVLSHPLPVIALVSRYLTNKLIGPRPLPKWLAPLLLRDHWELVRRSADYAQLRSTYQGITNSFATKLFSPLS